MAAAAASAKSADGVVILDVGPIISIIDCFVLASATNTRQVKAIVDEVGQALREHDDSRPINTEGRNDATWVLLDYGDIVVHVFLAETRAFYDLDRLWADASRIPFDARETLAAEG